MSYIFEALKKVEQERAAGKNAPQLHTPMPTWFAQQETTTPSNWLLIGLFSTVSMVALLLWFNLSAFNSPLTPKTAIQQPTPPAATTLLTPTSTSPTKPPTTDAALPLLNTLPSNIQVQLESLHLDVHVYADNPKQRFVLINGKRYHEGMSIQTGLTLLRIRPEDVVLQYQTYRFRLPTLM